MPIKILLCDDNVVKCALSNSLFIYLFIFAKYQSIFLFDQQFIF